MADPAPVPQQHTERRPWALHDPTVDPGPNGIRLHTRGGDPYAHVADLTRFLRNAADEAGGLGAIHLRFACDFMDRVFAGDFADAPSGGSDAH